MLNPPGVAELRRPDIAVYWAATARLLPMAPPAGFRVFRRAYAGRPTAGAARAALLTGCFPHAAEGKRSLIELLKAAGYVAEPGAGKPHVRIEEITGRGLPEFGPDAIVVVTAASLRVEDGPGEDSIHVPLWMRGGALRPGFDERLVSIVDVMPTLLRMVEVETPAEVQGRSLLGAPRETTLVYGRIGEADEWRVVIRGFDKMVVNRKMEITGLYNLALDAGEENNLADSLQHGRLRDELRAHLRNAMRQVGDSMDPSGLKRR